MSKFEGTIEDFKKYFDGYCRNKVQSISRKDRRACNGICQHCGEKAELQSAHVKGEERLTKIEKMLDENFVSEPPNYSVDLNEFEKLFIKSHRPIAKHFLFLCPVCHRKYDREDEG